jgi:methylated-DNA-[protein]-cysteine S-methyltransferase
MKKQMRGRTIENRVARPGTESEAWLREAFALPPAPPQLARHIMEQLDLRLKTEKPALTLARLDLAASPAGITRVSLRRSREASPVRTETGRIGRIIAQARKELEEYFAGERTFFTVPADLSQVPSFERSALEIAAEIPYGKVRSYKWIAERLGKPDAARAVGNAMAGNPVPIIVPCHRVVKTDGGLGGYSFGLLRKEALLNLERTVTPYIGCASTKIFCQRGCAHERRIQAGGRIHFASSGDARTSGYRPCNVCQPM